ncbi:hypothetical protein ANN_09519 [Periplaneta americana]|uniref:Uncharacterized protein n=1 Tax=Periplaneta americana TaxID=6978 RepID=A0ABQ8TP46_PERAM|nr:hypothetical protein ANN_09519 [Periplaneta americana]
MTKKQLEDTSAAEEDLGETTEDAVSDTEMETDESMQRRYDEQRGTAIVYRHGINVVSSEMHPSGRLTSLLTDMHTLYVNVYLHSGTNRKREREYFFTNQMPFYLRHTDSTKSCWQATSIVS